MTAYLEKADEVLIAVAADVIDRWHPLLRDARIGLLYRSEGKKRGNGKVLAAISLVPSTLAVASGLDYVMWVAKDAWDKMSHDQRLALIDHEFCHAGQGDKYEWTIFPHDVEEFVIIIERHGLWKWDLQQLGKAVSAAQLHLPGVEPPPTGGLVVIDEAALSAMTAALEAA